MVTYRSILPPLLLFLYIPVYSNCTMHDACMYIHAYTYIYVHAYIPSIR